MSGAHHPSAAFGLEWSVNIGYDVTINQVFNTGADIAVKITHINYILNPTGVCGPSCDNRLIEQKLGPVLGEDLYLGRAAGGEESGLRPQ
jgi:hypothetical protein